jgi:hypothetical protein
MHGEFLLALRSCASLRPRCTYVPVSKKNPPFGGLKTLFSVGGALLAQCNEKTLSETDPALADEFHKALLHDALVIIIDGKGESFSLPCAAPPG